MSTEPPKKRGRKPKLPALPVSSAMMVEEKRHGGSRQGAGAKKVINRIDVVNELNRLNFNPLHELVKIAGDPNCEVKLKTNICTELLGYCAPKLKATEMKIDADGGVLGDLLTSLANAGRPKPPSEK